jgi:Protein of unknown function (DUF3788)
MKAATRASVLATNAFAGYAKAPTPKQVNDTLGNSKLLWDRLLAELARDLQLKTTEWNTSAPKRGWSFRIKQGERIIAYLTPQEGGFHACFVLGDRALKAAMASDLSPAAIQLIRCAKKCAAGTGIRLNVQTAEDVAAAKQLAAAKLKA